MLGKTVTATMKITTKVAMCLYMHKMVLPIKMTAYKMEFTYSALNTIMVKNLFMWLIKPVKLRLQLFQLILKLNPTILLHVALLSKTITHNLARSIILR